MFEVEMFGWRSFLAPLALLGSVALLSLLFLLVRMHEKLNLINGLYGILFAISAIGVPLEVLHVALLVPYSIWNSVNPYKKLFQ